MLEPALGTHPYEQGLQVIPFGDRVGGKQEGGKGAILTLQLPPFLHGLLSHSLVSISQLVPAKPARQLQV